MIVAAKDDDGNGAYIDTQAGTMTPHFPEPFDSLSSATLFHGVEPSADSEGKT